MTRSERTGGVAAALVLVTLTAGRVAAQDAPAPPMRAIPGITADDAFPHACVSCHVVLPDGRDMRLSALLRRLAEGADSALLTRAQPAAPAGVTLTGRHPRVSSGLGDIPAGCLACHGRTASEAPPFARLIHRIHLVGGEANHFLAMFQGECTYCHKLDPATGAWRIPSGPEP